MISGSGKQGNKNKNNHAETSRSRLLFGLIILIWIYSNLIRISAFELRILIGFGFESRPLLQPVEGVSGGGADLRFTVGASLKKRFDDRVVQAAELAK